MNSIKATIKQIRLEVRNYGTKSWIDIYYSVDGSDKIYKHTYKSAKNWKSEEVHQFLKSEGAFEKASDRSKTLSYAKTNLEIRFNSARKYINIIKRH